MFVALAEQDRERDKRELSQYNNRLRTVSSSVPKENVTVAPMDVPAKINVPPKRGHQHGARFLVKEHGDTQVYPKAIQRQCRRLDRRLISSLKATTSVQGAIHCNRLAGAVDNKVKACDEANVTKIWKVQCTDSRLEQPCVVGSSAYPLADLQLNEPCAFLQAELAVQLLRDRVAHSLMSTQPAAPLMGVPLYPGLYKHLSS
jgi:hypothetical protein